MALCECGCGVAVKGRFVLGHNRRGVRDVPAAERFLAKLTETPETNCWIWTASRNHGGYGWFAPGGRKGGTALAHRWGYEHFVGPIPDGFTLDHLCATPSCVNPGHLDPCTSGENSRRSPRTLQGQNARKTHCPHGHPLDGRMSSGKRYCLTCNRLRARKRKAQSSPPAPHEERP
jgi:hypothetical protein